MESALQQLGELSENYYCIVLELSSVFNSVEELHVSRHLLQTSFKETVFKVNFKLFGTELLRKWLFTAGC